MKRGGNVLYSVSNTEIEENNGVFEIPNDITKIHSRCFAGRHSLQKVIIPNSVKEIEYFSFSYCSELRSIIIPQSVCRIGFMNFAHSFNLKKITINDIEYDCLVRQDLYIIEKTHKYKGLDIYEGGELLEHRQENGNFFLNNCFFNREYSSFIVSDSIENVYNEVIRTNNNYNEYIERRVIEKKIENNGSINRRKKIL